MPTLSRIEVFPIKSLPGVSVKCAKVLSSGALEHDRRFALIDSSGCFINAKRTALIHRISAEFDLSQMTVRLDQHSEANGATTFSLIEERSQLEHWFSKFFGEPIEIVEQPDGGFPDDPEASGVTIVSEASLQAVDGWFDDLTLEEVRRRFRTNLEVDDAEAFWEDRLFAHAGVGRRFQIGNLEFAGVQPCQRCAVPARDSLTGEVTPGFASEFARHREETLPVWAELGRFDHFFRLSTNTVLQSGSGRFLEIGQGVVVG